MQYVPNMSEKEQATKRAYNIYAGKFDEKFGDHFERFVDREPEIFISSLSGSRILDLGSGPGNHSQYFKTRGLEVLCADISEEMVRLCREKGLDAEIMDMRHLDLPNESFDGVWSYASLLHIDRHEAPNVVSEIERILKPGGALGLAVKEGEGEGFEENYKYPDTKRWFVYYKDEEIRQLFRNFEIISFGRERVKDKYTFLQYIMKQKGTQ